MSLLDRLLGRDKRPQPAPPEGRPFHITIGTASREAFSLETDLRMLRSALLYAGQVKLVSITTSGVLQLFSAWGTDSEKFLQWGEENVLPLVDASKRASIKDALEQYKEIFKKRHRTKDDLIMLRKLENDFRPIKEGYRQRYPVLTQKTDIKGIQKAIKLNLLELQTFKSLSIRELVEKYPSGKVTGDGIDVVEEFVKMVSEAIADGATYPLFDDTTGHLIRMGINDGAISVSSIRVQQAKHSALAANLFERLPDFSLTSIDEILDIREELRDSLDRFQSGISKYADTIKTAPWYKDFQAEADELFIREVKPGILEIEELVESSNSLRKHLWSELKQSKSLIGGGGAIGYLVDGQEWLPKYASIALGGTIPAGLSVWEAIGNWRKERSGIKSKTLYFYYRLRDKVDRSR